MSSTEPRWAKKCRDDGTPKFAYSNTGDEDTKQGRGIPDKDTMDPKKAKALIKREEPRRK